MDAITVSLSKELGSQNIRINSILPGATETEGAISAGVTAGSDYEKMFIANTPLGRRSQPEDIAKAAVFLAWMMQPESLASKSPFRPGCTAFNCWLFAE